MEITNLIRQRFPISLFLTDARQMRDVSLRFADSVPGELRGELISALEDLSIDLHSGDFFGDAVSITISRPDPNVRALLLQCTGDVNLTLQLEGTEPVNAAMWSIFALATAYRRLLPDSGAASVRVQTLSLERQLAARALLETIGYHRAGKVSPETQKQVNLHLYKYVAAISAELSAKAPTLTNMLVPAQGLQSVHSRFRRNVSRKELLEMLECYDACRDNVDAFCEWIHTRPEYNKLIQKYVSEFLRKLRHEPLTDIGNALGIARPLVEKECNVGWENQLNAFNEQLSERCNPGFLSASGFIHIFEPMNKDLRQLAAAKLRILLAKDFCSALMQQYEEQKSLAQKHLNRLQRIRGCYVQNACGAKVRLDWGNLEAISPESISVPSLVWSDKNGSMLADVVQGGLPMPQGFSCTWLGSETTADMLKRIPAPNVCIHGMDSRLLVAFMIRKAE